MNDSYAQGIDQALAVLALKAELDMLDDKYGRDTERKQTLRWAIAKINGFIIEGQKL